MLLPMEDMQALPRLVQRSYKLVSFGQPYGKMSTSLLRTATGANALVIYQDAMKCLRKAFWKSKSLTCGESTSWDHFLLHLVTNTSSPLLITNGKGWGRFPPFRRPVKSNPTF